jgi:methionyl-tRNA synthetase
MNKFYITTAIDYVNDTIHLGHAFQKIAADVLARYYRITIGKDNVFFLTGTDEYGQKAEKAAKLQNLTPSELVKKISDSDQKEQDLLNISYDRFIRTTDADHAEVVKEIWNRVQKSGDIYSGEYQGCYCEGCEAYYVKEDLVKGKCPVHPTLEIKTIKEQNYFFRWTKYKDFLIKHIENNPDFIYPKHRAKEMLEFAKNIKDIPISRGNFTWGIPVPNDPKQVIYVWFDALINYLTGIGFLKDKKLFDKFWPADIHILGKDNLRWHALLWPAMLKSAGIPLPKTILVNGFLNINGQKISKSTGNVIRPSDWVKKYGADAVRYYLLRYTSLNDDSDISEEKLLQAYNSDLANGLGNLVARTAKLCELSNYSNKISPQTFAEYEHVYKEDLLEYKFNQALEAIWIEIESLDIEINKQKPWELVKIDSEINKLYKYLDNYIIEILKIGVLLKPLLPNASEKIEQQFKGPKITADKPLFPRMV